MLTLENKRLADAELPTDNIVISPTFIPELSKWLHSSFLKQDGLQSGNDLKIAVSTPFLGIYDFVVLLTSKFVAMTN